MPSRAALMQGPRPSELIVVRNKEIVKKRRAVQEPVIIYVESPKVIHAHPSEFRSVVQRLTGAAAPSSSTIIPDDATASASAHHHHHLPPQFFPSQQQLIYGHISANKCDDMDKDYSYLPSSVYSYLPQLSGGGGSTSLINSFFSTSSDHQLPAFLFEDQNMAPPAVACPTPTSSLLLPPSSIIGGDSHGNRFIDQYI